MTWNLWIGPGAYRGPMTWAELLRAARPARRSCPAGVGVSLADRGIEIVSGATNCGG